jgi:molecular chaperone HtpG
MVIPKEFMDVLDKDTDLSGVVRSTFSRFDVIIQESKFEFFPEYTKHDSSHVEAVLANAKDLIGESLFLLNARDITVLILSILVHDLGMHLTFEGFNDYFTLKATPSCTYWRHRFAVRASVIFC